MGEEAWLRTKECDGFAARYWLLQKYKGVVFVDDDVKPHENRNIAGLEWNAKKLKGWEMAGLAAGSFP